MGRWREARKSDQGYEVTLRSELALDYEVIERPVEDRIYSAKQKQAT